MGRLRLALATSAVLGLGGACGYGGDATGTDAGRTNEGGRSGDGADASRAEGSVGEGGAGVDAGTVLRITQLPNSPRVILDDEGRLGWIHWGVYDNARGYAVNAAFPTAIPLFDIPTGNDLASFPNYTTNFVWTNGMGTPIYAQEGSDTKGVYLKNPQPPVFSLKVPATTVARRLVLYAGLFAASAVLTATLGADEPIHSAPLQGQDNTYVRYAIDFRAAEDTDLLVTWVLTDRFDGNNNANITLSAATLSLTP